ncbi:hypothetical protein [Turicimonas muris]|uniref:hypothetical protein n=1 Tax=Turicimonas muris TaxID=1796652 RepID=UPI002621F7F7|nr:hypothetical protein [Turicimonas muris]
MRSRLELQKLLEDILGSRNVYFQPPESIKIKYPCIIYERSDESVEYADNVKYRKHKLYSITIIDKDPDSEFPDKIEDIEYCEFERSFANDNLNHFVYRLYY